MCGNGHIRGAGIGAAPAAAPEAPGAPGATAHWTTGAKQGVGTSAGTASKVWYTLAEGVLSEVYYPRVDVADSRALRARGHRRANVHRPREHATRRHAIELVDRPRAGLQAGQHRQAAAATGSPRPTSPTRRGRRVLIDVDFESLDGGRYAVYAIYDPSLNNSGRHDAAASTRRRAGRARRATIASALVGRRAVRRRSPTAISGRQRRLDRPAPDHRMDWAYSDARRRQRRADRAAAAGRHSSDSAADAGARLRRDRPPRP